MTAFVNLGEKQADGNVFGDFAFDSGELTGIFIDPQESMDLGKDGSEPGRGFEGRVGFHSVLGKHALAARFASEECEKEGMERGLKEIIPLLPFLSELFQRVALRAAFAGRERQR